jgi:multiple sugar transport system permease protein
MALTKQISRRQREERLLAIFLIAPAALIMAGVTVYPLARSLWISLLKWDLTKPQLGPPFIGFDNYLHVLKDPVFWQCAGYGDVCIGAVGLKLFWAAPALL